jgi:hypothetical protein
MVKSLLAASGGPAVFAGILAGEKGGEFGEWAFESIMKAFDVDKHQLDPGSTSKLLYELGDVNSQLIGSTVAFEATYFASTKAAQVVASLVMGTGTEITSAGVAIESAAAATTEGIEMMAAVEGTAEAATAAAEASAIIGETALVAGELGATVAIEAEAVAATSFFPPAAVAILAIAVIINVALVVDFMLAKVPDDSDLKFRSMKATDTLKNHNLISMHKDSGKPLTNEEVVDLSKYFKDKIHGFRDSNVIEGFGH